MKGPRAWAGEFIGTFGFVTIGCASVVVATAGLVGTGLFGVAWAHGLGLAIMVTSFAAISGGHLNPAVTLSAWIGGKIEAGQAVGYVLGQVLGAVLAAVVLRVIFTRTQWVPSSIGTPGLGPQVGMGKAVVIEAIFTFFLALAVWGTGIDDRGPKVGGFAIGLMVFVAILVVGRLTGAALNPARYLGPAIVSGHLQDWWVYLLGPGIGGAVAGLVYPRVFMQGR